MLTAAETALLIITHSDTGVITTTPTLHFTTCKQDTMTAQQADSQMLWIVILTTVTKDIALLIL